MKSLGQIWRVPALLALATLAGLMIALFSEQSGGRVLAWALLSLPLLAIILRR